MTVFHIYYAPMVDIGAFFCYSFVKSSANRYATQNLRFYVATWRPSRWVVGCANKTAAAVR